MAVAVTIAVPVAGVRRDLLGDQPAYRQPRLADDAASGRGGHVVVAIGRRGQFGDRPVGEQDRTLLGRHRRVPLDELALRGHLDDAGLVAVRQRLGVLALQAEADPLGHPVGHHRPDEDRVPGDLRRGVQRDIQVVGDDVVGALQPQDAVERDHPHADRGPGGRVARTVVDMVLCVVTVGPAFDERPQCGPGEDEAQRDQRRDDHVPGDGVPGQVPGPAGHHPQRALEEAHVEVGLRARRDLRRVVRTVQPDRVDLGERGQHGQEAEDEHEPRAGLGHEVRVHRLANHVRVGVPQARHLGVLLVEHEEQVRGDQGQQQRRDQQHVDDVQPRDDVIARELPAEQEERQVGADDRDAQNDALGDPQPGPG